MTRITKTPPETSQSGDLISFVTRVWWQFAGNSMFAEQGLPAGATQKVLERFEQGVCSDISVGRQQGLSILKEQHQRNLAVNQSAVGIP